jgi:succinyl-diaminopimelate desuccinylase
MDKLSFDEKEALELLQTLVSCRTVNPPGGEAVLAERLKDYLLGQGLSAAVADIVPGRANLVARLAGEKPAPALLLLGHLDTVPAGEITWRHDPFAAVVEDGLLYGRGAADMKGAVAAMLYALVLLKRAEVKPPQDIVFVGTSDEERGRLGAENFLKTGGMNDIGAVLVGEPSNGDMLLGHKGAMWTKVTVHGQTAHGSMPHLGINAVAKMAKFIDALTRQRFAVPPDPLLGEPTFSVNTVKGGVATNVVPDACVCTIDIRVIPGQSKKNIQQFIEAALAQAGADDSQFKAEYEFLNDARPLAGDPAHKIVAALEQAAGKSLVKRGVNYYTDASTLIGDSKLPFVIYGPGDDKQAHQPDEYIELSKYYEAIAVYFRFMRDFAL